MKRVLSGVGLVLGLLALLCGVGAWLTFGDLPPIPDGAKISSSVHVVKDGYVAAFIVDRGDGQVALVDAGMDKKATAILAALQQLGRGPADVRDVLLTHGHPDHIGGIAAFPQATVHALAAEVALTEGREAAKGPITQLFPAQDTGVRVGHPVSDGEQLTIGPLQAQVFAVPGHTAGSAAWLVDGVLFLGDSADATHTKTLVGAKWLFTDNPDENAASLRALAKRIPVDAVQTIACAHTGVLSGAGALTALAATSP